MCIRDRIYNPTSSPINLSHYQLERYSNGSTNSSSGGVTQLSGVILPGDVFVVTNGDTISTGFGPISMSLYNMGDYAEPNGTYPTPLHMNGNDAIVLSKSSISSNPGYIVDIIGKLGEDPGAGWTDNSGIIWTMDHTLVRKPSVMGGVTQNPIFFDPTLEWDLFPVDTWNHLGSHTSLCITPSWDCISPGNCQDPGTGNGTFASLTACQSNCVAVTYDCINNSCIDPGTGNGTFTSLTACK